MPHLNVAPKDGDIPPFKEFIERLNTLSLSNEGNITQTSSTESIVDFSKQELSVVLLYLDKMKQSQEETRDFHDDLKPFLKEIGDELAKLDDLYRVRGLLVRIVTIREIHEKIEWLLNSKTKQNDADTKLMEAVDLFQRMVKVYEEIAKSSPVENPMRKYVQNVVSHWFFELKARLESKFQIVMKQINWPLTGINSLPGSASTVLGSATFDTLFTALFKIQIPDLEGETENAIRVCLPIELMILPLRKRFLHHFMKKSRTNQLDKPEWYLTQTLNWIKDNSEFLVKNIDPILRLNCDAHDWVSSKIQFICGLLEIVKTKLKADLSELIFDERLFSHTLDEVLSFTRELEVILGGNRLLVRQSCNLFDIYTSDTYFNKLVTLEEKRYNDYIEIILESSTAWLPIITPVDDDDVDEDELRAPEAVDNFVIFLQSISDRSCYISDLSAMQEFIELQLKMIEDFRVRLIQLSRACQDETEVGSNWALSSTYFGIINAINYIIRVLEEWRLTPFFIEATTSCLEHQLDKTISDFKYMLQEMTDRIMSNFDKHLKPKLTKYASLKWFCVQPLDENVRFVSCELLYYISSSMQRLKSQLATGLFSNICHSIARRLNMMVLEDVILKTSFNEEGAKLIARDVQHNMCSLFNSYTSRAEPLFAESTEATTLLNLQRGTAMLLEESIYTPEEDSCLNDLGIEILEPEIALKIAKHRIYVQVVTGN
ncbi:RAD50-interacting protein 1 [Halotydeus destructor]|nr:RAD50-interacting protein 1 [Halotydeus destructor]